jgi:hypothetical protein
MFVVGALGSALVVVLTAIEDFRKPSCMRISTKEVPIHNDKVAAPEDGDEF